MSGLFRHEVIEATSHSWLGDVSLSHPVTLRAGVIAALLAIVAVTGLLCFGQYTQRARVAGKLVPDLGLATSLSPFNGVVSKVLVREGEHVMPGEVLVVLTFSRSNSAGTDVFKTVRQSVAARRDSLDRQEQADRQQLSAQRATLSAQLQQANAELKLLHAQVKTKDDQYQIGRKSLDRYEAIAQQKFVSQLQLEQQQQATLEILAQKQALERELALQRRSIAQIEHDLNQLPELEATQQAALRRDRALLDTEAAQNETEGELAVTSPVEGIVSNSLVNPGQSVQAGQLLISVLPTGSQLLAQLSVPSSAIGFVAKGDKVQLRYRAFPYEKFGHQTGTVVGVARAAVETSPNESAMFRVKVALDRQTVAAYGKDEPLRAGMDVDADILGDSRRLYEWVLEPVQGLARLVK